MLILSTEIKYLPGTVVAELVVAEQREEGRATLPWSRKEVGSHEERQRRGQGKGRRRGKWRDSCRQQQPESRMAIQPDSQKRPRVPFPFSKSPMTAILRFILLHFLNCAWKVTASLRFFYDLFCSGGLLMREPASVCLWS